MPRRIALATLALGLALVSCSQLPPEPEVGAVGGMGGVGVGGADGGMGGSGGVDPCSVVVPEATSDIESVDGVQGGIAIGTVSTGADPLDRWSLTTCGGSYDIVLTWDAMTLDLDLDLLLLDSGEQVVDSATTRGAGDPSGQETIAGANLPAGQELFIEVRAIDTQGEGVKILTLNYRLKVFPSD